MENNNFEIFNEHWEKMAEADSDYMFRSGGNRWLNVRIADIIKRNQLDKSVYKVIDIGCGDGSRIYSAHLNLPNAVIDGYDFSECSVELANKKFGTEKMHFHIGDVTQKEFNENVDMVTAFGVLEHIEDWQGLLEALMSIGKKGPKYIMIYTNTGKMHKNEVYVGHLRNFKRGEIENFITKKGWKVLDASYGGFPFYDCFLKKIQYANAGKYMEQQANNNMTVLSQIAHTILFIILRYFCFQDKKGAEFIAVFENMNKKIDK